MRRQMPSSLLLLLPLLLPLLVLASQAWADTAGRGSDSAAGCQWDKLYQCLDDLPEDRQARASEIVSESLPALQAIDARISLKMDELKAVTYSDEADAETLPKLGMDLQRLRNEMRDALMQVNLRLMREVGVQMPPPAGRGCRSMRVFHHGGE
ncbi:MAG: hypothetical protein Q4F72_02640 [Desulfovibrionaceae bacterium]|nr:hypothetical protein [Desulfovibrionaceae bacterium]